MAEAKPKNSKRIKVVVERKYSEDKHKIFASTLIRKDGEDVLQQFRIPVGVPVELPVEIIDFLKQRKIPRFDNGKQTMVREFVVEQV